MAPTGETARIVQVHATLRCNLRCLHCYSSSGPEHRSGLDGELLAGALRDAADEGYNVASFSGGEPLLVPQLAALLDAARGAGMVTTLVTNGMLLTRRRLCELEGRVDALAISLDGVPESHDRMRGSARAFAVMASRLPGLAASGIPFGFVFTLTRRNIEELPWVARFAAESGAQLLQIHPLEAVGRALETLDGETPEDVDAAQAWLAAVDLAHAYEEQLAIRIDLVHGAHVRAQPEAVYAVPPAASAPLAELVSPLVIEASGDVVPLEYGFPREHALGNLLDAPLPELAARWRGERCARFHAACARAYDAVTAPTDLPVFNWYEEVARRAVAV